MDRLGLPTPQVGGTRLSWSKLEVVARKLCGVKGMGETPKGVGVHLSRDASCKQAHAVKRIGLMVVALHLKGTHQYPLDGRVSISPADPPSTFEIQFTTLTGDGYLLNAPCRYSIHGLPVQRATRHGQKCTRYLPGSPTPGPPVPTEFANSLLYTHVQLLGVPFLKEVDDTSG